MGLQQSKEALLYQHVIDGNIEGIKALHREGASLEWFDKEGKTALIAACMNPQRYDVAKTLIELGANVNAYRPGGHAGTALHHAVKKGLDQTVKLLLSHGANALALNDDHKTPLEVARVKGHCNVVRTIESHICFFSGWLRELYGPGFMEVFAPHLLSKKIWVVVLPCGSRNPRKPRKPLRLELAMYNSLQDARPRTTIALWKAKVEEPKFYQPVPVVNIFDKSTKKKFRLASSDEGERQQLQWLSNACRGIPQVMHPTLLTNAHTSVVPPTMPPPNGDDVELAMAMNASLLSAREEMPRIMHSHSSPEVSNATGWGSSADISRHNGWHSAGGAAPSEANSSGWLDEPAEEAYNGWGTSETKPSSSRTQQNISATGTTLVSVGNSANSSSHHGSGPIGGSAFSSGESCGGWLNNPFENVQNGWGTSETGSRSNLAQNNSTSVVPLIHATPQTASLPSAPPVPEGADDGPIQYPSIDFSSVDLTMPNIDNKDSGTSQAKEDGGASSSCVICLDAPVEGACVPCGHMAGCMSCLNGIKAKEWGCPVCRTKINQVIRLYAV